MECLTNNRNFSSTIKVCVLKKCSWSFRLAAPYIRIYHRRDNRNFKKQFKRVKFSRHRRRERERKRTLRSVSRRRSVSDILKRKIDELLSFSGSILPPRRAAAVAKVPRIEKTFSRAAPHTSLAGGWGN